MIEWLAPAGGILKTLVGVIFTTYGVSRYQSWINRRIWKLKDPSSIVFSVSTSGIHEVEKWPMTGIGQVRALANITPSILRAYSDAKLTIYPSQRVTPDKLTNDIIIIGGGRTNDNAKDILNNHSRGSSFIYNFDEFSVEFNGKKYAAEYWPHAQRTQDNVAKDYAYVRGCKNPYNKERRVVLLIGIHTHGTEAAARLLVEMLRRRWYLPTNFEAFAEVTVKDQEILGINLIEITKLKK